jgi:hypothetical protein
MVGKRGVMIWVAVNSMRSMKCGRRWVVGEKIRANWMRRRVMVVIIWMNTR